MGQVLAKDLRKRSAATETPKYTAYSQYMKNLKTGSISFISSGSYLMELDRSYMIGWDTPHFHARTRKGELIPMTPWKQFTMHGSTKGGGYAITDNGTTRSLWYNIPDVWAPVSDWVLTEDILQALLPEQNNAFVQEAAAKVYGNGYDALTALAELVEVRSMFFQTGKKLYTLLSEQKLWKALRKFQHLSKKARVKFLLKDLLAGNWMELRYGWRTLVYDMMNVNDLISHFNEKRTRYSEKAGHTSLSSEVGDRIITTNPSYDLLVHTEDHIEVALRGSVVADIEIPKLVFNPIATAWELIPLSFVLDWVLTVGKSIAAASFLARQDQYTAASGVHVKFERTMVVSINRLKSTCVEATLWQEAESVASLQARQPCAVPIQPHFTLDLNTQKVIDLMSIIIQRVWR